MKYIIDNDLHIHSQLSLCSDDPHQTNEQILRYAEQEGLSTICLTNHFWDERIAGATEWYAIQNYAHIAAAKPLPQSERVRFLFGCEVDLDQHLTLGISKERLDLFDFIIIPTTHFHMTGFTLKPEESVSAESRAKAWCDRLRGVLHMNLPFYKIGLAHLTCDLIAPTRSEYLMVLRLLPEQEMQELFSKAAQLGVGIELNAGDMSFSEEEAEIVLRPYRIAKACGCKFYCGSDAHHPTDFDAATDRFRRAVDLLNLTEDDKFTV